MIVEQLSPEPKVSSRMPAWRIAVIAAVVMLAVAIGAVLGVTLTRSGGPALSGAAAYVPADAPIYFEARLDLPGTQRANLRAILERFPGVDPDSVLGDALAETLDSAMQGSGYTYSDDVAPWFDGQVAFAMPTYPSPLDTMTAPPSFVAFFGVSDLAAARDFTDRLRADAATAGSEMTSSVVDGVTVWSGSTGSSSLGMPAGYAFAVTDDEVILASGLEDITTALDVHAGSRAALADRDELRQLASHLPDEVVGLATIDLHTMFADVQAAVASQAPELADLYGSMLDSVPSFMVETVSFEADALRMDAASALPSGLSAPGSVDMADQVPADTLFFSQGPDLGTSLATSIGNLRDLLSAMPDTAQLPLDQVEGVLGGDVESFVSWIGGGAIAAGYDGDQAWAGLVLEAADADAARQKMGQLGALVALAASDPSSGVTISTDSVAGTDVTTVRFSDPSGVMGPTGVALQWAFDGDRVLIGVGDRFVGRALQLDAADSLGATARYQAAEARMGASGGLAFVDLAGIRQAVAAAVPPEMSAGYAQAAPYLEPLDYLAISSKVEGDTAVASFLITVK